MRNKNKKGMSLLDLGGATIIIGLLSILLYNTLSSYYTTISRVEENNYINFSLAECAEVAHSFRYGEIDRSGSSGWLNYQARFPTGLYKLNYNKAGRTWESSQIYKDQTTGLGYDSLQEMLKDKGYTPETEGEILISGANRSKIYRYIMINNNSPEKSIITCFAKYDNVLFKRTETIALNDYKNYERLKIIMTDY